MSPEQRTRLQNVLGLLREIDPFPAQGRAISEIETVLQSGDDERLRVALETCRAARESSIVAPGWWAIRPWMELLEAVAEKMLK